MKRKIIKINEELCNGCSLCAQACHEGAIGMKDGKAVLLRDDYCDGLGDCLPVCPTGAISFEEREALSYDEEAVKENMKKRQVHSGCPSSAPISFSCPGSRVSSIKREEVEKKPVQTLDQNSELTQWPVQIKLVPIKAPFYDNAKLLIAADCTAFSYGNFHKDFIKDHITIIGCPKLDEGDYSEKLTAIIRENNIKQVTIVRMEVPCCSGLSNAAIKALKNSEKMIPWKVVTISTDGQILED